MVAAPTLSHLTARQCRRARRALQRAEAKRVRKITAATPHRFIDEQLTPFGGMLALEKLLDALAVEQAFHEHFIAPSRTPELGHWRMVKGLLDLHFIGLHRLHHFTYVKDDAMLKGVLTVEKLPAVSEFYCWEAVETCRAEGLDFIFSVKKSRPAFDEKAWYSVGQSDIQYNAVLYQPKGWKTLCRFVAMRSANV
jgi:hypothetical protein